MEIKTYLAPMASYTDQACRIIYKDYFVDMFTTEMVSSKALYYKDRKTETLTETSRETVPVSIQIFGNEPDVMAEVVEKYLNPRKDFVAIDINMGCPAPKIVKNGSGSALLADVNLAEKVIKAVVNSSNKPVSVKLRKGIGGVDSGIEIAQIAEKAGVSYVTLHGRTREMYYIGEADWEYIKTAKENLSIPLIGNGDIESYEDAMEKVSYSSCDGVAIGRAAIGNPWIFKEIYYKSRNLKYIEPTAQEKIEVAIKHLNLTCDFKGERIGVREMRKQFMGYLKGLKNSAAIREKINNENSKEKVIEILTEYGKSL